MATRQSIPYGRPPQQHMQQGVVGGSVGAKVGPTSAAAPAAQFTPNDLNVPDKLYKTVPKLEYLKKLTEAERELDLISTKKELDFHVIHAKSISPANFKKETGTLRVFIYNTCENQPWQKQLSQQRGEPVNREAEGSWTLRVEGKALTSDGKEIPQKFSSFLTGVSIDLIPNDDYPSVEGNVVEWRDSQHPQYQAKQNEFDGIDVKRQGIFNLHSKIAILTKVYSAKLKLSDSLSQFMGRQEATQQEVVYSLWNYILYKDLIMKKNISDIDAVTSNTPVINEASGMPEPVEKDLTIIKCDAVLKDILKVEQFRFSQIYPLISGHFLPRQPIVLDYEINTRKSNTLGDLVIDVPIELPFDVAHQQKEVSDNHKKLFTEANQTIPQIADLNGKIAIGVSKLKSLDSRRQFYQELNDNPVEFIKTWTAVQSETLKSLKSDEGYNEEVVRRAEYFEENEDVLKQKIDLLLGTTKY